MRLTRKSSEPSDDQKADHVAQRLHIVSALVDALSEPERLMQIVCSSETPDVACARVQDGFNLDELQARAVMDTQYRQATVENMSRLREHRSELEAELRGLRG